MIEISAALFILLVESLVILAIALVLVIVIGMRKKRKKHRAVAQLVAQIKKQSEVRTKETGSFLQEIYQLEDAELKKAVETIDKSEKTLFQKLIESYLSDNSELIVSMDAAIAELIDTYKNLKPKELIVEKGSEENEKLLREEVEKLKEQNDKLREELGITKETMGNMIAEFGNMFGGGSDHELANFEVVEKVGNQSNSKDGDVEMF